MNIHEEDAAHTHVSWKKKFAHLKCGDVLNLYLNYSCDCFDAKNVCECANESARGVNCCDLQIFWIELLYVGKKKYKNV